MSESNSQPEIGKDGKKVPTTNDPDAWAATFVRIIKASHRMELPVESMKTWFERALAAGYQDAIETFIGTQTRVYGCYNRDQIRAKFVKGAGITKQGRMKSGAPPGSRWKTDKRDGKQT